MAAKTKDIIIDHESLPPWEACAQCSKTTGKEGIVEYSGAEDGTYLCCSCCKKYVHPTCDKINEDPDGIYRYFCQACRTQYNKKIAWKRKKPTRRNSQNLPIESPMPENDNIDNAKSTNQQTMEETEEQNEIETNQGSPTIMNKSNIKINETYIQKESTNGNENTINIQVSTHLSPATQHNSSKKQNSQPEIDEYSQFDYESYQDIIPAYQPPKTPAETPEKEENQSINVTTEEVREALVNLIESQPESLRKQTKKQLNLDPNVTLSKVAVIPPPGFSPNKSNTETSCITENKASSTKTNPSQMLPIPTHTYTGITPTQQPPTQCYPPNIEATMFTNINPIMSTETQPLQYRTKQEIIARYEKKEKEMNQLQIKYDQLEKKLKEIEDYKVKYEITLEALTITTTGEMTPEERVTSLQKDAVENQQKIHKLEKRNEELKKDNTAKQCEIRKTKDLTKTNMQVIHELEAYKETAIGQIARLEELSRMKSDQISSMESLMGSQDIKIHNLRKEHSEKMQQIETNHQRTKLAMATEIQKQKEEKEKIEIELKNITKKIIGKKDETEEEVTILDNTRTEKRPTTCLYFRLGLCKSQKCQMNHEKGIELNKREPKSQPLQQADNANKICIHHRMGKCRRGEKCPFKHEIKEKTINTECIYHNRGFCNRGDQCKFKHKENIPDENQNNKNQERKERCIDFDNGYCPRKQNCQYKHCKDRVNTNRWKEERRHPPQQYRVNPDNTRSERTREPGRMNANRRKERRFTSPQPRMTPNRDMNERCEDFDKGYCPRKNQCQQKHCKDRINSESTNEERCRYFDRGYCQRGETCRYTHLEDRNSPVEEQTEWQHNRYQPNQTNSEIGNSVRNERPMPSRRD